MNVLLSIAHALINLSHCEFESSDGSDEEMTLWSITEEKDAEIIDLKQEVGHTEEHCSKSD